MKKGELIRFDVRILGRVIPLKIKKEEEVTTANLIKEVNTKIADFQLKYNKVDDIDSLIMVLLEYVFEKKGANNEDVEEHLLTRMKTLSQTLKKN